MENINNTLEDFLSDEIKKDVDRKIINNKDGLIETVEKINKVLIVEDGRRLLRD